MNVKNEIGGNLWYKCRYKIKREVLDNKLSSFIVDGVNDIINDYLVIMIYGEMQLLREHRVFMNNGLEL